MSLNNETCQRGGHLKVVDQCALVSQSMTKDQSASTEFGQKTVIDKVQIMTAAVFMAGNYTLHQLCKLQLPENRDLLPNDGYKHTESHSRSWRQEVRKSPEASRAQKQEKHRHKRIHCGRTRGWSEAFVRLLMRAPADSHEKLLCNF